MHVFSKVNWWMDTTVLATLIAAATKKYLYNIHFCEATESGFY